MNTLYNLPRCLPAFLLAVCTMPTLQAQETVDPPTGDNICLLSSLDLTTITYYDDDGTNGVYADRSTINTPLTVRDTIYSSGVGTHAPSVVAIKLKGATRFYTKLGIDDTAALDEDGNIISSQGIVSYSIYSYVGETKSLYSKGTIRRKDASSVTIDIDVSEFDYLLLKFDKGANTYGDYVDLCDAYFEYEGEQPALSTEELLLYDVTVPTAEDGVENIPLSDLEVENSTSGALTSQADLTVNGNILSLGGTTYYKGVGTQAPSQIIVKLNGSVTKFYTIVGIDDEAAAYATTDDSYARADYKVYLQSETGDIYVIAEGTVSGTDTEYPEIEADVNGWKYLILENSEGEDGEDIYDYVDWANAYLEYQDVGGTRPEIVSADELSDDLACATTVFSQPGIRFMHKVRAVSSEASVYVTDLPDGLSWNEERQLVDGIASETEGEYHYTIVVTNNGETTEHDVTFTISSELQQPVPFMGWISWNSVESDISEEIVYQVADLFLETGLYECGWNTVMMDDWWHANSRASDGKPQPNATRFPNGLTVVGDYLHEKGLKFGIYTDVAEYTCAGAFGSYGYETIDANQYAEWGIDAVKCDYCSAPEDVETAITRYTTMGDALKASGRDILFYICEWGVREPWKWGAEAGGSCWRVSYDVRDCWVGTDPGVGVTQSIDAMKNISAYTGVNRFNDADMLCTGLHGTGNSSSDLCASGAGMTQDEYKTQFSLWCMWSSPMALSFDPRENSVTEEDYAIMMNTEMIALNQDRMGQQADLISEDNDLVIFAKDLENGDIALSVTNLSSGSQDATFDFSQIPALELEQEYTCRDLWAQEYLDPVTDSFSTTVDSHATRVFRLSLSDETTEGIATALSEEGIEIHASDGKVLVSAPGTEGQAKRILISDVSGRVIASASVSGEQTTIPLKATSGVYIVTVVCNAQATTSKIRM